jgi:hypothetical protein
MPRVWRHRISGSQAAVAARSQNIPYTLQTMFGQRGACPNNLAALWHQRSLSSRTLCQDISSPDVQRRERRAHFTCLNLTNGNGAAHDSCPVADIRIAGNGFTDDQQLFDTENAKAAAAQWQTPTVSQDRSRVDLGSDRFLTRRLPSPR